MSSSGRLVEERKIGILMIEPDMRLVLDCGKPLMVDSTDEVRSSEGWSTAPSMALRFSGRLMTIALVVEVSDGVMTLTIMASNLRT